MSLKFSIPILVIVINSVLSLQNSIHPLSDEFIDSINQQQNLWTAGRNFHRNTPLTRIKRLAGTIINHNITKDEIRQGGENNSSVRVSIDEFDARWRWPYCSSMSFIRDQGGCSSSWAVAVASVMTDRICIVTAQAEVFHFSEQDILGCCEDCLAQKGRVCQGGSVDKAWIFAAKVGVVSGGTYGSKGGCKAYKFKPCHHGIEKNDKRVQCHSEKQQQICEKKCTNRYQIDYKADKKRFNKVYRIKDPMSEIFKYGPITANMKIYIDFINYKNGIYRATEENNNRLIGYHTVKILGWGVDEATQTKYWLAANSWNSDWGDKGFFKIVRGENHCDIEKHMIAGLP